MKLRTKVGLGPGHIVLDGKPAPLPLKGHCPQFSPMSVATKRLDGSRCHGWDVGLAPGHTVIDGDPAPPPPNGHSPQFNLFSAHVCCGQTAGWIEMPFSREVGLSPSDIVLDGEPGPFPQKGGTAPPILANVLWPNGCFKTFRVPWQTFAKIGPGTSKNRWTAKNKNNKTKNITVFGYRYTRERRATVKKRTK